MATVLPTKARADRTARFFAHLGFSMSLYLQLRFLQYRPFDVNEETALTASDGPALTITADRGETETPHFRPDDAARIIADAKEPYRLSSH